ncbi:uncharacterized protein FFB14_01316 [Fusarium fujikuroi]|nr:uncharacterized protein FFB14_01316 [Fusarium fujikuroi]
MHFKSSINTA